MARSVFCVSWGVCAVWVFLIFRGGVSLVCRVVGRSLFCAFFSLVCLLLCFLSCFVSVVISLIDALGISLLHVLFSLFVEFVMAFSGCAC